MRLPPPSSNPRASWTNASYVRLLFAAVTMFALVTGQMQVLLHVATVQHVVCAEHDGAVEDVRFVHASAADTQQSDDIASVSNAPDEDHGHEDCSLIGIGPTALRHDVRAELPASPYLAGTDAPAPEQLGARGPPLLSFAPKLSPPEV